MTSWKIVSAILLELLFIFTLGAGAADYSGLRITSIVVKDDRGNLWSEPGDVEPLMMVRPGDAFSREAIRKGIRYLYLKKQFRDIQVSAVRDQDGVRLEYTVVPVILIDKIVIRGNHSLRGRPVRDAIGNIAGKELREEGFFDIRAAIQALYQSQGFYDVRVSFLPKPSVLPHRRDLYVYIREGDKTIIDEVRFSGNTVFPAEQLAAVMANRKDAPLLTNILMERDLSAVQERYVEAGYPAAKTGPVSVSFRHGRALVEIAVSEGPKVAVSFSGTDAFCSEHFPDLFDRGPDSDRLFTVMEERCAEHFRNLLLIWSEHDVSDTVIESSADKIRTAYRESGYADAKVDVRLMEGPGFLDISFAVHEGPRVVVDRVQVEGTTVFTEKEIRNMIGTRASGWFSPHPFRQDILEGDAEAIADQYAAAGYHETVVKPRVTRAGDGSRAVVTLAITEGARTMTGSVTFDGNGIFTNEELMNAIMLKPGTPFGERLVDEDRYRILSLYATKGYLYARVEAERTMAPHAEPGAQGTVDVRFKIEEDRQVVIGTVILRGNVTTSDRVILRELRPRTGEPYRYETLLSSQQRIYRYGYFSLAKFEPVSPNAKEYIKDMLFTVEERPAGAVEFGVGYGDLDQLRGFAEVSHRNLWGAAHYASLRLEGSDILYRTAFTYQQPWFLGVRNLDSKLLLAWSDSKRINQDTREIYYQTEKTTASYGAERTWNGFKASLTYQFENVKNYNVQPAAELSPEDSGRVLISSLNPAIVYDLRDDPFNPRRGSVHGANVKEALSSLGSEAGFTKATLQTTWFIPATGVSVLALSGRAGMAWPHRNTLEVPIHERFYLGGSTTVRGYTQDSIGPGRLDASGDVIPTGGSSMVQLNAEVRLMAGGGSGFVLFTDAGNVWVDQHIRLDDLRASFGAGFRYHTPVGPLRIDYGQKINRRPGESPGELHFNIGHAF